MEKWFVFTAYNSQAHYGFGTEHEADAYAEILNRKRDVNVYGYEEITDQERLDGLDSGRDTDGFRLDEALGAQAEIDAEQAEIDAEQAEIDA